ncbi:MAG: sodium:calcium antiporter [Candidatus Bipolaricaulota bacterium]|nr:sodium:calcium antiporter [Candidatus Bipolaricaulota bacterium]
MSYELAWGVTLACLVVIWFAGRKLTHTVDIIATRTGLGRVFIGSVLLAATTSLPEVATEAAAAAMGLVDIALGDLFGSNIYNMTILAVCGFLWGRGPLLAAASRDHVATAALGMMLSAIAALAILTRPQIGLLGIGIEIYIILAVYLFGLRLLRTINRDADPQEAAVPSEESMVWVWMRFFIAASLVISAAIFLSQAADVIATVTGLGGTFIGTTLVAATTSAPELITSIVAVRMGAVDLAVGNVLGSNIFNMNILLVSDLFYRGGYIISAGNQTHAITALVGLVLSGFVTLGLLSPIPGRLGRLSLEAILLLVFYFLGTYLVFLHR